MDKCASTSASSSRYALAMLPREVPAIQLYGPLAADLRGGVVPFNLPGVHPHDVAQVLDRFGVAVRAGHHCTMPLHERLDLAATARASFGVYTTKADIDALASGLREVAKLFGVARLSDSRTRADLAGCRGGRGHRITTRNMGGDDDQVGGPDRGPRAVAALVFGACGGTSPAPPAAGAPVVCPVGGRRCLRWPRSLGAGRRPRPGRAP